MTFSFFLHSFYSSFLLASFHLSVPSFLSFLWVFMVCAYDCVDAHSCRALGIRVSFFLYLYLTLCQQELWTWSSSFCLCCWTASFQNLPVSTHTVLRYKITWLCLSFTSRDSKSGFTYLANAFTHWTISVAPPFFLMK